MVFAPVGQTCCSRDFDWEELRREAEPIVRAQWEAAQQLLQRQAEEPGSSSGDQEPQSGKFEGQQALQGQHAQTQVPHTGQLPGQQQQQQQQQQPQKQQQRTHRRHDTTQPRPSSNAQPQSASSIHRQGDAGTPAPGEGDSAGVGADNSWDEFYAGTARSAKFFKVCGDVSEVVCRLL
jgi:hypothetical protein